MVTGFRQERIGADFRNTPGMHIPVSGGVASKPVAYSELEDTVSALEAAYTADIASEASARAAAIAAINNLSSNDVQSLIDAAIAGGIRYKGLAEADETDPEAATGETTFATGDLYKISTNGSSAFSIALNVGDMVIRNSLGGWDKIDNTDPSVSAPNNDPIEVSQTGDNAYSVSLKSAFVSRVSTLESGLSTAQSDIDALETSSTSQAGSISSLQSAVTAVEGVNTTQTSAIAGLVSDVAAIETVNATQTTAISALETSVTAVETSVSTVADDLAASITTQAGVDSYQDTLIAGLTTDLTSVVDTNTAQGTAIYDLQQEVALKVVADQLSAAVANFYASTHKIVALAGGVFDGTALTTTFYIDPGFESLKFAVVRMSESASPYEEIARPQIEYVSANAAATAGNYAKITFFYATQVPNSTIQIYCQKFYDDGETITVDVPAGNA